MIFALVGNQNCGKTTLFNALTGSNQHVGNFPGVTVDQKMASSMTMRSTPGCSARMRRMPSARFSQTATTVSGNLSLICNGSSPTSR